MASLEKIVTPPVELSLSCTMMAALSATVGARTVARSSRVLVGKRVLLPPPAGVGAGKSATSMLKSLPLQFRRSLSLGIRVTSSLV